MTSESLKPAERRVGRRVLLGSAAVAGALTLGLVVVLGKSCLEADIAPKTPLVRSNSHAGLAQAPVVLAAGKHLTVWWDALPSEVRSRARSAADESNIHPPDYVGPSACQECHADNYQAWSTHPHRWMNALATAQTVLGDFSGAATLNYRGGKATFERKADAYFMRLERGGVRRTYRVTQTIGSRFFQYFVGRQTEGPEPATHHFYQKDHVLPFGWWLEPKEWIPIVHIGPERPDEERSDPFAPPEHGIHYAEYAVSCNYCHTTFPLADLLGRRPQQMGEHVPLNLHWSVRPYLANAHPVELQAMTRPPRAGGSVQNPMADWDAAHFAATYGVSCEACHLGARAHVESHGEIKPSFFPKSPHLYVEDSGKEIDYGRSHDNVNWACGRCHTGSRPTFAAGMSTWNSVEYSDAMRGSCYSKLRCIDCHNPHRALGAKWSVSADHDDNVCIKCHEQLRPAAQRLAHTHHPVGSEGARCMNCHMPRINEGLQQVVRTHMIYSPNRADMIQANHPNACNLCHTDRPIDWTLGYLKQWYGSSYDAQQIADHYPNRGQSAASGWLKSENDAVRLVGADALARASDAKGVPQLLGALDDPYLVNRQFAAMGVQKLLGVRLADFGYRFYLSRDERRGPLANLRAKFIDGR